MYIKVLHTLHLGVNIKTSEEVAIKLVTLLNDIRNL